MKKIILGTSLALALLSGCGSDGDSKVAYADAKVEYKTAGAYKLSDYLVPAQNQISNYVENTYTNKSGKRDYSKTADEGSPSYTASNFDVNGSTIKESIDNVLDTTYNILADKITSTDADGTVENYVLFADKGDYISKTQGTDENLGAVELVCKLANHYANKIVSGTAYDDVIEVSCTIDSHDEATVGGSKIEVIGEGTNKKLFAKNKGLISDVIDFCTQTKTDGTKTKATCVKTTQEITTIN